MASYRFTAHAWGQGIRRAPLESPNEFLRLLDEGRFVLRQTEGTGTQHLLVYSKAHRECRILVCDPRTKEVVTISLLALNKPGARSSNEERERARKLALGELDPPRYTEEYKVYVKVYALGSSRRFEVISPKQEPADPENAIADKAFLLFLQGRLNKILGRGDILHEVLVKFAHRTVLIPTGLLTLKESVRVRTTSP